MLKPVAGTGTLIEYTFTCLGSSVFGVYT